MIVPATIKKLGFSRTFFLDKSARRPDPPRACRPALIAEMELDVLATEFEAC